MVLPDPTRRARRRHALRRAKTGSRAPRGIARASNLGGVFRGEAATSQNDHRSRFPALEAIPLLIEGLPVDPPQAAGHTIGNSAARLGGRFGGCCCRHSPAGAASGRAAGGRLARVRLRCSSRLCWADVPHRKGAPPSTSSVPLGRKPGRRRRVVLNPCRGSAGPAGPSADARGDRQGAAAGEALQQLHPPIRHPGIRRAMVCRIRWPADRRRVRRTAARRPGRSARAVPLLEQQLGSICCIHSSSISTPTAPAMPGELEGGVRAPGIEAPATSFEGVHRSQAQGTRAPPPARRRPGPSGLAMRGHEDRTPSAARGCQGLGDGLGFAGSPSEPP